MYAVIRRVLGAAATVLLTSLLCFVLLRAIPGDPARVILGPLAPPDAVDSLRQSMGLDKPLLERFVLYLHDFFTGDWGYSYTSGLPVRTLLSERVMPTVELGLTAFVFAFGGALILALISTYRRRRAVDRGAMAWSFVGTGAPPFWTSLIALIIFWQALHLFPGPEGRLGPGSEPPPSITGLYSVDSLLTLRFSTFADACWHLILPAAVLAFPASAALFRLLRSSLLGVRDDPFLTVVRGKGISPWSAFRKHALPNAFLPTLTASGLILGELLVGSVLVESIFSWPGIGQLIVQSIQGQDFAVVQAFIQLGAVGYVVINACVDILYRLVDPRVRLKSKVLA
ncbi:peptide/nickel transport system permease protein [Amycolatopsis sulphurea]|uniref:Peptide/nickel transport system permease protein n=1 Tax=Amycolatopsis sulphurea TaxID=76022 RepID=A0A2A9FFC0_9PSEU|nr:ABC transporter permease [Amycolatopsis sulphurea]PFG49633.1 peptide/nickel transport system permease protein [Amycolatopsis sulphurea]